eukprot:3618970-Pyramimonas_sp.AAC.1
MRRSDWPPQDNWEVKPEYKHAGSSAVDAKPFGAVGEEEQGNAKKQDAKPFGAVGEEEQGNAEKVKMER